jgi:protein-S-isoprenylcysteine O-methyltransferase Ste14
MRGAAAAVVVALAVWLLIGLGPARVGQVLGGLLAIASLTLLAAARIQLGEAFAVAPRAKVLVTGGLYSRIPHPMYLFLDLSLLGIILGLRMPVLLLGWIALVAVQSWQAAREDRVLEQAFGDAYREYRRKTWW